MRCSLFLMACAVSLAALNDPALAQIDPEVLFVFDSSGSMLETAGATTKIAAAKRVMHQAVGELAPDVRVGLVAYGHRRKQDCSDIEVLVPPGSTDRAELLHKIDSLQPVGVTPISGALSVAINLLKLKENETTLVLVSDGKETCHADPCELVKQLKGTGIKFVLHVVGFQVDSQVRAQLECLAREGGGNYFQADNPERLLKSLQEINQQVTVKLEAAKSSPVRKGTGLGSIELSMVESSRKGMAGLEIVNASDGKIVKKTEALPAESKHPLLDGEYEVYYLFAQPNFGEPFRAKLGTVRIERGVSRKLVMGAIEFNVSQELAERAPIDRVVVVDSGSQSPAAVANDNSNGYYNFVSKAVLPGIYDVQIQFSNSPLQSPLAKNISVPPGKAVVVTLDSGIRLKPATSVQLAGWDLVPVTSVAQGNPQEAPPAESKPVLEARPHLGNSDSLWLPYPVAAGTYKLLVRIRGMDEPLPVDEQLEIKKGELIEYDTGL